MIWEEIKELLRGDKMKAERERRETNSSFLKIEYIMKNYEAIQKKIFENKLPKKEDFLRQILEIVKSN